MPSRQIPELPCPRRWVLTLLALLVFAAATPAQEKEPEHLLLIFAGQSNMEGKGTSNTASKLTDKEKAVV
ncbi:MAG: hypothetical protein FJ304_17990, partial [Planctomycetes bacterium]|nr:hypothetical protein [Planctomycetota bacterium]